MITDYLQYFQENADACVWGLPEDGLETSPKSWNGIVLSSFRLLVRTNEGLRPSLIFSCSGMLDCFSNKRAYAAAATAVAFSMPSVSKF